MKKTILFILPLFAMTIAGCGSKKVLPGGGKLTDLATTVNKFETSLMATVAKDAIGLKLNDGSLNLNAIQNSIYAEYDPTAEQPRYSIGRIEENLSLSKVNINVGIKNINKLGMANVKGSANASAQTKLTYKTDGVPYAEEVEKLIGNINENLKAEAYLDNGLFYFNVDEGLRKVINAFASISTGKEVLTGSKYYIDTGLADMGQISLSQALAISLSQVHIADTINNNIPSFIKEFLQAYEYSSTKYAVYANININTLNNIFKEALNIPYPLFNDEDKGTGEAIIIFDTMEGISEIKLKADLDATITIQEYINYTMGGHNYYGLTDAELKLPYMQYKGSVYFDFDFLYGSKVNVSEIKNKSDYQEWDTGSHVDPDPESERMVDFEEFVKRVDSKPNARAYKRIRIELTQNEETIATYDSNDGGDNSLLLSVQQMNVDSLVAAYDPTIGDYEFYVSSDGFRVNINRPQDNSYFTASFNQYGELTFYGGQTSDGHFEITVFYFY